MQWECGRLRMCQCSEQCWHNNTTSVPLVAISFKPQSNSLNSSFSLSIMLTVNGKELSVQQARTEPGHVLGGQEINVVPDGRCAASVILAAFNVDLNQNTRRTDAGFATSHQNIFREEQDAKSWLEGVAKKATQHGRAHFFTSARRWSTCRGLSLQHVRHCNSPPHRGGTCCRRLSTASVRQGEVGHWTLDETAHVWKQKVTSSWSSRGSHSSRQLHHLHLCQPWGTT